MSLELIITGIAVLVIGGIAVWRSPKTAGEIIGDIISQVWKKRNDIKRNNEDDPRD